MAQATQIPDYEKLFDTQFEGENIYVTVGDFDSGLADYIVSLEKVSTREDTGAADFADQAGLLTEEQAEAGDEVTVWIADDPYTKEYFASRAEAYNMFVNMIHIAIEAEVENLSDNLAVRGTTDDHDWIVEGNEIDIKGGKQDAREGVVEYIVTALTAGNRGLSESFARYVVGRNAQFVDAITDEVWNAAVVAAVVTAPEAGAILGIQGDSVTKSARRGAYHSASDRGGVWLLARSEVEARSTD